jgi:hypothetical protein
MISFPGFMNEDLFTALHFYFENRPYRLRPVHDGLKGALFPNIEKTQHFIGRKKTNLPVFIRMERVERCGWLQKTNLLNSDNRALYGKLAEERPTINWCSLIPPSRS